MKSLVVLVAAILLLGLQSLPSARADDKIYRNISPEELTAILSQADLESSITSGTMGEPLILVQQGELKFLIRGVDCITGPETRCSKIQFRASIGLDDYPSAAWMNEFNRKWIFGKAYVGADGIAHVEYPLNLSSGITEANLLNNFILWSIILDNFIEHLDGGEIAPMM